MRTKQFPASLVDCPTQLTLIFTLWYLYLSVEYFMTNIKVTNMKKYSREICYCLSCPKWSVWNLDEKQPGLGCTPDLSRYSRPFCPTFIESSCGHSLSRSGIIVPSSPCLPLSSSTMTSGCASAHTGWATFASIYLFKVHNVFFQISNCICPNCQINLSKLQNVFVQMAKSICPNFKMYLSKLLVFAVH